MHSCEDLCDKNNEIVHDCFKNNAFKNKVTSINRHLITKLRINNCTSNHDNDDITDNDVELIGSLHSLESLYLNFDGRYIGSGIFDPLSNLSNLRELRIMRCKISIEQCKFIKNLTKIELILFEHCDIDQKVFEYMQDLLLLKSLIICPNCNNLFNDACIPMINKIRTLKHLECVIYDELTPNNMTYLKERFVYNFIKNKGKSFGAKLREDFPIIFCGHSDDNEYGSKSAEILYYESQ
jgi:hypothetical protein